MVGNIKINVIGTSIDNKFQGDKDIFGHRIVISSSSPTDLLLYGTITITKTGDNAPIFVKNLGFRPPFKNPSGTTGLLGSGFSSCGNVKLPKGMLQKGDKIAINANFTVQSPDGLRVRASASPVEVILGNPNEHDIIKNTQDVDFLDNMLQAEEQNTTPKKEDSPYCVEFLYADALITITENSEPMLLIYQRVTTTSPNDVLKSIGGTVSKTDYQNWLIQMSSTGYEEPEPKTPVEDVSGIKDVGLEVVYKIPAGTIAIGDELIISTYGVAGHNNSSWIPVPPGVITVKVRLG